MDLGSCAATQLRSYTATQLPHKLGDIRVYTTRNRARPWVATQLHSYTATQLYSYPTSWEIYESIRLELGPWMALGGPRWP